MPVRPARKRGRGIEIRPGSVREARLQAGLSLAEGAGGDLTRAAIHLVEHGRSRPSMRTLELIAERTAQPVAFFLPGGVGSALNATELEAVERLVEIEDFGSALTNVQRLLEKATHPADRARLNYLAAESHLRRLEAKDALEHARKARELCEQTGDRWLGVDCLAVESAALGMAQMSGALELAERALAECRRLDPRPAPTEAKLLNSIAGHYVARRQWEQAITRYQEALEVSSSLRDISRMARMHEGLSASYNALGNASQASAHSRKALALHGMVRDQRALARAENNLADVLLRQGDLKGAERHFTSALRQCEELGIEQGRSHVLLSLAEVEIGRGALARAEEWLAAADDFARRMRERRNQAKVHQLRGTIAAARGDRDGTDAEFEAALAQLHELKLSEELAEALSAYAQLLEARGETARALEQTKQAFALVRPHLGEQRPAEAAEQQAG